jgi:hypothetical protein
LSSRHLVELQNDDNNKKESSAKNDEDEDEDDEDEYSKDEADKDEDGGPSVTMGDKDFLVPSETVERHEPDTIGRTKRWILSSGTDVGQVLTTYSHKIPESQKCIE